MLPLQPLYCHFPLSYRNNYANRLSANPHTQIKKSLSATFFHLQLKSVFYSIDIVIYEPQRRIIFILCAFAGCLEILNLQKSALWADRLTCLSEVCNVASLRGLLMLLADFCRFIAVLVNNAFKTVQQSAKDKEDICRRADARQRYLTQDFTLWWAGLRCIIY